MDPSTPAVPGEILVATYNVEALFDTKKDSGTQDHEYLPSGWYNWTEARLARKLENIGRVLRSINGGRGPDILALNEVENAEIAERLRAETLAELDYQTLVHRDTACAFGLDNVLLSRFPLRREARLHPMHVAATAPERRARGVLEVALDVEDVELIVFVNHWPAGERSEAQRTRVGAQLRKLIDQRQSEDPDAEIVVMGDFNARPDDASFGSTGLAASADPLAVSARTPGAKVYNTGREVSTHFTRPFPYTGPEGTWNAFDQILVVAGLLDDKGLTWVPGSTQVVRQDFMLAADATPRAFFEPGVDPRRQAPEAGGFSDHLPLVTRLRRVR